MKPAIDFENALNPQQHEAVTHGDGPQLVLAGAGSGKTRVITYRIAWLVREQGISPGQIAAVTFTNKAAQEMKERVEELLGLYPLPTFVGTFHRFALRQLRAYGERVGLGRGFAILDSSDQKSLVKKAVKRAGLDEKSFPPSAVLAEISNAKNRLLGPVDYDREAEDFFRRRVAKVYHRYQALLRDASGVDFDDMIRLTVKLLRQEGDLRRRLQQRYRYLLVDEFQDTNHAQLTLIQELIGAEGQLTAVGDEDQGIYRWRGAELENILHFERTFPGAELRKLEQNYRSTQNILDASGGLIAHNEKRRGKTLWTASGAGEKITLYRARDEQDEARWLINAFLGLKKSFRLSEMAILVRTNAQTRALEEELLRKRVAYRLVGGIRFYERAEIKDLVAYLRAIRNPEDPLSLLRIINQPPRGIGKTTQDHLTGRAEELGCSPWRVLETEDFGKLSARATKALLRFRNLLKELQRGAEDLPLPALLEQLLESTGYLDLYEKNDADSQAKAENIREFLSAAQEFVESHGYGSTEEDLLTAFLDHASLVSDLDGLDGGRGVTVLTLHAAKGLEFPVVAVTGLEDGLLPHFNAQAEPDDIEEERRLLYVGMTRAEKQLYLTCCRRRRIAGRYQDQRESPFLPEIPASLLHLEQSPEVFSAPRNTGPQADQVYAFFGRSTPAASEPGPEPVAEEPAAKSGQLSFASISRLADAQKAKAPAKASGSPKAMYKRGTRVRHATLGNGRIMTLEGSGDDLRLSIYFEGIGRRKLVAKYAKLDIL